MASTDLGRKIASGTIIIVIVGLFAKFASFIAEAVLAAYLGTSYQSDAFYMVTSIQNVIYPMLSVGIWKVFLPVYKEKITIGDRDGAEALSNKLITLLTIVSLVIVGLLIILSEQVVSLVAPGFQGETKELCAYLVRLSSPMYSVIIAAAVYASILQCHDKFLGSQIREVASHIPVILAAVFFYKKLGINSLAFALVAGGLCRLLIELPFVDWGYKYKPDFRYRDDKFIGMLRKLPSALISEGVNQINTLVDKVMASLLPEGTVSGLNYGSKLMNVFSGLISSAIATVMYPQMIELIALNKKDELSSLVNRIINIFAIMMIPITVACMLFNRELVTAVYARGSFDMHSIEITSGIFAFYSLGLFFIACNTVLNNVFYSEGDTKTPMYISIANLICNVSLNLLLISLMGINGLPLATSLSAIITFTIRLVAVRKHVDLTMRKQLITVIKILVSAIVACGGVFFVTKCFMNNVYLRLAISVVFAVPIYFIGIWLLKVDDTKYLLFVIKKKFMK